jgi:hypothetical protein
MRKYEGINSINFDITSFFCEYKMSRLKVKDQIICMISEEYNLLYEFSYILILISFLKMMEWRELGQLTNLLKFL